jgi:hypothetical protein
VNGSNSINWQITQDGDSLHVGTDGVNGVNILSLVADKGVEPAITLDAYTVRFVATKMGFFNAAPVVRPLIEGSRALPEEALANLILNLASLGLIENGTTA